MKNHFILKGTLLGLCLLIFTTLGAVRSNTPATYESVYELPVKDLLELDRTALETKIKRKLNLKERLTLRGVKRQLRKQKDLAGWEAEEVVRTNGMAVASLVFGILSFLILGPIFGGLAIIFGALALRKIAENPDLYRGRGLALAGLILGAIAFALFLLSLILAF